MTHSRENGPTRSATRKALILGLMLATKPAHAQSTTFTVTNTNDSGQGSLWNANLYANAAPGPDTINFDIPAAECTLRAAIEQANATPGADTINFGIPGTGVKTIAPNSVLPAITGPVTINGNSQPGTKPNSKAVGADAVLKIEISGASAPNANGLYVAGSNSTIRTGKLNSTPAKTFTVQFFSNPADGNEGKRFLGQKVVTTYAGGKVSFTFATTEKVTGGQAITATATGAEDTSEFSAYKTAVAQ